jgi:alpha-N-arabinofuranosidase
MNLGAGLEPATSGIVRTESLGKAKVSGLRYENPDGSPLVVDTDYFGKKRDLSAPTPGPFESPGSGVVRLRLW